MSIINNINFDWIDDYEVYSQSLYIIIAFICSYALKRFAQYRFSKTIADCSIKDVKKTLRYYFFSGMIDLSHPLSMLLLLFVGEHYERIIGDDYSIMITAQHLVQIWLLWMLLHVFINNTLVRTVATWILLPFAVLNLFGKWEYTVHYLNEHYIILGNAKITSVTVLKAIFFINILLWLGNIVSNYGTKYIYKRSSLNRSTKELVIKLFDIILYVTLFLITMNLVGVDLTALTVFSGAIGVGLGFGLQKIASNFISGIILLTEKSIRINDLIMLSDGVYGYVRKLGARASVVATFDGKEIMVPNEDFITSRIANLTHSTTRGRIDIEIGVSYDSNLRQVSDLMLEAANNYPVSSKEEGNQPQCYLREYGDSSVNFFLTFWLDDVTTGRLRAKSDVMFAIWDKFKEHGINIPFPQRDIHIKGNVENIYSEKKGKDKDKKIEKSKEKDKVNEDDSDSD